MPILSRDDLLTRSKPRAEVIAFPELGDGAELRIRGYTIGDSIRVREDSTLVDEHGNKVRIDEMNETLLSVIAAIEEPKLSVEDTAFIREMGSGVVDRILSEAARLSGRRIDAYEQLKHMLQVNPHVRRIYNICRKHFNRLPSELSDVPEAELMTAFADIELDLEETAAASRNVSQPAE